MKFADFVCFKAVVNELESTDRDGVITELVHSLDTSGCLEELDAKKVTKALIKRENEASTGLGRGVAIPHVKMKGISKPVATVGQSSSGIDFQSLDKQIVHSVILLISPDEDPDKHLQAMEKIFRHLQDEKFRKFLRQAQDQAAIKDLFLEADEKPFV